MRSAEALEPSRLVVVVGRDAEVVEEAFDYGNQSGISIGKIFGLRKPKYNSDYNGSTEDFGVICLDTAV